MANRDDQGSLGDSQSSFVPLLCAIQVLVDSESKISVHAAQVNTLSAGVQGYEPGSQARLKVLAL